jgi:hypothetical protein
MRTEDSHFHYFGRLYQQYIVDQYLKIEASKLRYIKHNQAKLMVELFKGLVDAFNRSDANLEETGQRIILPSSFNGGPRYMLNLFHDSMSIVKEFGNPIYLLLLLAIHNGKKFKKNLDHIKPLKISQT